MICRPDHFSWRRVLELSFIMLALFSTSLLANENTPQPLGEGMALPSYMQKMMGSDGKAKALSGEAKKVAKTAASAQLKAIQRNPYDSKQALREIAELAVSQCGNLKKYYPGVMSNEDIKECEAYTAAQIGSSEKMDEATASYTVKIVKIGLLVQLGQKTQAEADQEITQIFSAAAYGTKAQQ